VSRKLAKRELPEKTEHLLYHSTGWFSHLSARFAAMQKLTMATALAALTLLAACDEGTTTPDTEERFFVLHPDHDPELVYAFDPVPTPPSPFGETPESVATDFDGNLYVSLALTGEIAKIDEDGNRSTVTMLPLGNPADCLGPFPGIMGALAIDLGGNLYVPVNSCDLSAKGVYRISPDGSYEMIAQLPPESLGNGIAYRLGHLYVADSGSSRIFRAPANGDGSMAEVWVDEPLLADPNPADPIPGANGLQFYNRKMLVANAGASSVVAIDLDFPLDGSGDIQPDGPAYNLFGPAGTNAVWETDPAQFPGLDDFAVDIAGNIWGTTDPFQTLVRMNIHTGKTKVILTAEDGLDGPSSCAYGRGRDHNTLYITNAQFPFFPPTGNGPSVLSIETRWGGYPLR